MRNTGLEEAQAGIKIARRNINNLTYTDDTTLMEESEELKSLLMKVKKESEKVPSGSSQCTSPKHPVSCIKPGLETLFIHDILHEGSESEI